MNIPSSETRPTCAHCERVGTSLLLDGAERNYRWLCEAHAAQLSERMEATRAREFPGQTFSEGALIIAEVAGDAV